jgi:hypothetical protein
MGAEWVAGENLFEVDLDGQCLNEWQSEWTCEGYDSTFHVGMSVM